jgi:hypothetical protein
MFSPAILLPLVFGALAYTALTAAAPLAVYTVTLALFGLAHVTSEFAYVDRRFGRRLGRPSVWRLGVLLAGVVAARSAGVFGLLPVTVALTVELALVAALALAVAGGGPSRGLALGVALPLGLATALAPFETAVALAITHNFTPLGFLWEAVPRHRRGPVMALALAGFIGLPMLVASGLPRLWLGLDLAGADPMATGGLARHLHVYVPAALRDGPWAFDLFAACVVAQGAHYLAVIVILPALQRRQVPGMRGLIPWPGPGLFALAVIAGSAVALIGFLDDFSGARGLYGILASVHAWVEIPLLVLIVSGAFQPATSLPTMNEAAFAAAETANARRGVNPAMKAISPASTATTIASRTMTDGQ